MRPINTVLASLSGSEYERLAPHLEAVTLKAGDVLHKSGSMPKGVYFLDTGVASLSVSTADGDELELSIVGNESTIGERAIFDYDFFIIECKMLSDGSGHKMSPAPFKEEFRRGGMMHDMIINRLEVRITEASQTSLCNQSHSVEQRLARWLLTYADRSGSDELDITHDVIRKALGVTRSAITRAAVIMKEKGMIDYARGNIVVLDRHDLGAQSCECYQVIARALEAYQQIGLNEKSSANVAEN